MASCVRHVYKTMCEYDAKGNRKGKMQGIKYESRPKRGATPSKPTKTGEKKQAELTKKAAVKELLDEYRKMYSTLYERRDDFSLETINKADKFINDRPNLVSMFNQLRHDYLVSDREVVAFHRAVMRSKNKNILYSLDRRVKA